MLTDEPLARHTHGPGVDDPLYTQAVGDFGGPGDFYYYHKDGMNSVREITDEDGEVVQRIDYDSFGNILTINGCAYDPAANTITTGTGGGSSTETYAPPHDFFHTYAYTGRQWDPETGLYYYRARYYDASIGRFISEDPQWNVNPYAYVSNNPIKYGDPSGKWIKEFLNEIFPGFGDTVHKALTQWSKMIKDSFSAITFARNGIDPELADDIDWNTYKELFQFITIATNYISSWKRQISILGRCPSRGWFANLRSWVDSKCNSCTTSQKESYYRALRGLDYSEWQIVPVRIPGHSAVAVYSKGAEIESGFIFDYWLEQFPMIYTFDEWDFDTKNSVKPIDPDGM